MCLLAGRSASALTALPLGQPFSSVQRKHEVPQMRKEIIYILLQIVV